MKDFKGAGVVVYVTKRPGMESAKLLSGDKEEQHTDIEEESNLWDSLSRYICMSSAVHGLSELSLHSIVSKPL